MDSLESSVGNGIKGVSQEKVDINFQPVVAPPPKLCMWHDFAERGESYDLQYYECDGNRRCDKYFI